MPTDEEADLQWTQDLLRASRGIECEGCRIEIVQSGGVVTRCMNHKKRRSE